MVALFAAAIVSTAAVPASSVREQVAPLVLAKKKKPKKPKEKASETSEGLDLSAPPPAADPAPTVEPAGEPAVAAEPDKGSDGNGWSLVTPDTVGAGTNLIEAGVGWPGIYASYWRGILGELDVGAKVGFNWSYEGVVTGIRPGLRIQVQARYKLWDNGSLSLGLSFSPGGLIYFFPGSGVRGGLLLPLAATLGLPNFVEKLNLSVTLEVPFFVVFGIGAYIPFTLGANAEYFFSDSLAAFARLKPLGLAIFPANPLQVFYMFEAFVGAAYKL